MSANRRIILASALRAALVTVLASLALAGCAGIALRLGSPTMLHPHHRSGDGGLAAIAPGVGVGIHRAGASATMFGARW